MTFTYNRDIPDAPNNPSNDQPLMKTNTNSTDDLIAVNHYSFNVANGGKHKKVAMPVTAAPGSSAGEIVLFGGQLSGLESALFYQRDGGAAIQVTGINPSNSANGYTVLIGSLLMQWGNFNPNVSINVSFPISFSATPYSIQLTGVAANNSTFRAGISSGSVSSSGFTFEGTVNANWNPIYYIAIGPK